ncbi:MAG TPA: cytochrome c oxidase subunit 3 [Gammaproteobacteria bacterium]
MNTSVMSGKVLPVGSKSRHASGWWGMLTVVATEAALFAYLLFSYYYVAAHTTNPWPTGGDPKLDLAIPGTLILIAGSLVMAWGEHGIRRGRNGRLAAGLIVSILLALLFLGIQFWEWFHKPFALDYDAYSSLYFVITGFHMAHVAVGVVMLVAVLLWTALGHFDAERHSAVSIAVIYWHFVTIVWLAVFFTFYLSPRLI